MTDPETITRYWFLLENLIPHKVLAEEKEYKRIDLSEPTRANALLPWLLSSPPEDVLAVNPDELDYYYYQVYLGIFHERESCDYIESLELPEPDGFEENEPQNRLYYSASFQIDSAGIVNGGSLSISMFPWTLERVRGLLKDRKEIDPGEWLQDYSQYQNFLKNDFSALAQEYALNQDVIECEQLVKLLKLSCRGMWQTETASVCGYYKTQVVEKDNKEEPPEQILNSFYLEDLRRATVALEEGKASRPLVHYLSGQQAQRINAEERSFLDRNLTPDCLGLGRWPSKPEHNLSLMQQLAVNLALRELPDGGLFSVNGPPGTGKTTLLRDAIADLIVQRAAAMARYGDPSKAFTRGRDGVFKLDDALTGFEIVVASSNNGAVENISAELPTRSALAPEYRERADYFAEVSETIRGVARRKGKVTYDSPTWGLLAAVLGNSKNRKIFAKGFYFDKATSTATTITNVFDEEPSQWDEALRSFAECQLTVNAEITRRQQYWQDARRQALLLRQQQELNTTFQSLQDAAHQANVRSELDEPGSCGFCGVA